MGVDITALHWIYVAFIVLIIGFMVKRRDTTLICILGIFIIAVVATGEITASISGVFNSFIYAITELLSTILIISIIVAMSRVLTKTGINEVMVAPFARFIKTPALGYWTIGILMMVISWFFWPSPAVALLGAVLLPAAIRAGLPALGVPKDNKRTFIILLTKLLNERMGSQKQRMLTSHLYINATIHFNIIGLMPIKTATGTDFELLPVK